MSAFFDTQQREQRYEGAVTDERPRCLSDDDSQDFRGSDEPRSDFEWQASEPGPQDVLIGVDPDPALRERVREGLRPLSRKYYGTYVVDLGGSTLHVKKEPRSSSVFSTMQGTHSYVSALLVAHGGLSLVDAESFAVDLTRQITFDRALKERPEAARLSMIKELTQAVKFKTFHGIHFKDLDYEERKKILNSTTAYKEKFLPSGEFDKSKSRLLAGGHMQIDEYSGESSAPTARLDTIKLIAARAAYYNRIVSKLDFTGAYLNTPRPDDVQHKYLYISRNVARLLIEVDPSFAEFVQDDGRILVELDKMLYGLRESGYYWNKLLMSMFKWYNYDISFKDAALIFKQGQCETTINVDDLLAIHSDEASRDDFVRMCRESFEGGITVETGDVLDHMGMTLEFNRGDRSVLISQRRFIDKVIADFPDIVPSDMPTNDHIFSIEPIECDLLDANGQTLYRSIVMNAMYHAKVMKPAMCYRVSLCGTVFGKATDKHLHYAKKLLGYAIKTREEKLRIKPASMNIVVSADASFHLHRDGKGQSGFCVGFAGNDSNPHAYFMWVSSKQPLVAKSSMESELISADMSIDYGIWADQLLRELGECTEPILLEQDNRSTLINLERGYGSFKHTKHIDRRFYFVTDLIKAGRVRTAWVKSIDLAADLLTKSVSKTVLGRLVGKFMC